MNGLKRKFINVPLESDTRILFEQETIVEGYDALYQWWFWDMFIGESLIFSNDDVEDLTDQEIEKVVRTLPIAKEGSAMTLNRSDSGFTFCNFNFE